MATLKERSRLDIPEPIFEGYVNCDELSEEEKKERDENLRRGHEIVLQISRRIKKAQEEKEKRREEESR